MDIATFSDHELRQRVLQLVAKDRSVIVQIAEHLAEVEKRELHLTWGFNSLWDYCNRELSLTESVAYLRINLARLLSRRPKLRSLVLSGELGLCVAAELAAYANDNEFETLLAEACKRSKREFKDFMAERLRKPAPSRGIVRRMTGCKSAASIGRNSSGPASTATLTGQSKSSSCSPLAFDDESVPRSTPTEKTHRISLSASEETVELLDRLKDLMGTTDLYDILKAAFDSHLEKVDPVRRERRRKKRAAKYPAPRAAESKSQPRRPPRPIIDRVLVAAGSRCGYVGSTGIRCSATRYLQVDHIRPFALGGSSTDPGNLRMLCREHNQQLARKTFGLDYRKAATRPTGKPVRRESKGEAAATS